MAPALAEQTRRSSTNSEFAMGMQLWEISQRELRQLKQITDGSLLHEREEIIICCDDESSRLHPRPQPPFRPHPLTITLRTPSLPDISKVNPASHQGGSSSARGSSPTDSFSPPASSASAASSASSSPGVFYPSTPPSPLSASGSAPPSASTSASASAATAYSPGPVSAPAASRRGAPNRTTPAGMWQSRSRDEEASFGRSRSLLPKPAATVPHGGSGFRRSRSSGNATAVVSVAAVPAAARRDMRVSPCPEPCSKMDDSRLSPGKRAFSKMVSPCPPIPFETGSLAVAWCGVPPLLQRTEEVVAAAVRCRTRTPGCDSSGGMGGVTRAASEHGAQCHSGAASAPDACAATRTHGSFPRSASHGGAGSRSTSGARSVRIARSDGSTSSTVRTSSANIGALNLRTARRGADNFLHLPATAAGSIQRSPSGAPGSNIDTFPRSRSFSSLRCLARDAESPRHAGRASGECDDADAGARRLSARSLAHAAATKSSKPTPERDCERECDSDDEFLQLYGVAAKQRAAAAAAVAAVAAAEAAAAAAAAGSAAADEFLQLYSVTAKQRAAAAAAVAAARAAAQQQKGKGKEMRKPQAAGSEARVAEYSGGKTSPGGFPECLESPGSGYLRPGGSGNLSPCRLPKQRRSGVRQSSDEFPILTVPEGAAVTGDSDTSDGSSGGNSSGGDSSSGDSSGGDCADATHGRLRHLRPGHSRARSAELRLEVGEICKSSSSSEYVEAAESRTPCQTHTPRHGQSRHDRTRSVDLWLEVGRDDNGSSSSGGYAESADGCKGRSRHERTSSRHERTRSVDLLLEVGGDDNGSSGNDTTEAQDGHTLHHERTHSLDLWLEVGGDDNGDNGDNGKNGNNGSDYSEAADGHTPRPTPCHTPRHMHTRHAHTRSAELRLEVGGDDNDCSSGDYADAANGHPPCHMHTHTPRHGHSRHRRTRSVDLWLEVGREDHECDAPRERPKQQQQQRQQQQHQPMLPSHTAVPRGDGITHRSPRGVWEERSEEAQQQAGGGYQASEEHADAECVRQLLIPRNEEIEQQEGEGQAHALMTFETTQKEPTHAGYVRHWWQKQQVKAAEEKESEEKQQAILAEESVREEKEQLVLEEERVREEEQQERFQAALQAQRRRRNLSNEELRAQLEQGEMKVGSEHHHKQQQQQQEEERFQAALQIQRRRRNLSNKELRAQVESLQEQLRMLQTEHLQHQKQQQQIKQSEIAHLMLPAAREVQVAEQKFGQSGGLVGKANTCGSYYMSVESDAAFELTQMQVANTCGSYYMSLESDAAFAAEGWRTASSDAVALRITTSTRTGQSSMEEGVGPSPMELALTAINCPGPRKATHRRRVSFSSTIDFIFAENAC